MTLRDFIKLLALGEVDLDKELIFSVVIDDVEYNMAVDGVDEASDENFIGVNLKDI
jgi:hypothetical protein